MRDYKRLLVEEEQELGRLGDVMWQLGLLQTQWRDSQ